VVANGDWITTGSYYLVSLVCSLLAFQILGINNTIPRFISLNDLLNIAKVVLGSQLMTTLVLFTFTRLDGIPRSVPTIQALVLGTGLVAYRGLVKFIESRRCHADRPLLETTENVILVGLNDRSVLVMRFVRAQFPERWRVIALLDQDTRWVGRSVNGVQVFGPPAELETVIEEFATHGVRTDQVLVGVEAGGCRRKHWRRSSVYVRDAILISSSHLSVSRSALWNALRKPLIKVLVSCRKAISYRICYHHRIWVSKEHSTSLAR
jgi:FlaA1/EpsC-like NDP-sugar epimerase